MVSGVDSSSPTGPHSNVQKAGSDLDRRNKPGGARGGSSERFTAGRNSAARAHSEAVVSRKKARGRMDSFREGWKEWVTLNATDLTWMALVIGGVLFTTLLMRG